LTGDPFVGHHHHTARDRKHPVPCSWQTGGPITLAGDTQSPKESWLRVVLIEAGLPRPQTQIAVTNDFGSAFAYLDMGWEDVKVAVEYDGEQHRSDRRQYSWDVRRLETLERLGWIVIRVVAGDRPAEIVRRVRAALDRRMCG
jgi:hypothetical protein